MPHIKESPINIPALWVNKKPLSLPILICIKTRRGKLLILIRYVYVTWATYMLGQFGMSSKGIGSNVNIRVVTQSDMCHQIPLAVQHNLSRLYLESLNWPNKERME